MRTLLLTLLCAALLTTTACATPSTPGMGCADPRAGSGGGGLSASSNPSTGNFPGAPGWTATYTRGGIGTMETRFDPHTRQAGAIATSKMLSGNAEAGSIPLSARCACKMLDVAAAKWAAATTPEQEAASLEGLMRLLEHVKTAQADHLDRIVQLAPDLHDFVNVFIDSSGSSTEGEASGAASTGANTGGGGTRSSVARRTRTDTEGMVDRLPVILENATARLKELKDLKARDAAQKAAAAADSSSGSEAAPEGPDVPEEPASGGGGR